MKHSAKQNNCLIVQEHKWRGEILEQRGQQWSNHSKECMNILGLFSSDVAHKTLDEEKIRKWRTPERPTVSLPRLAPVHPNRRLRKACLGIPSRPSRELHPKHSTWRLAFHLIFVLTAEEKLLYDDIHDTLIQQLVRWAFSIMSLACRTLICLWGILEYQIFHLGLNWPQKCSATISGTVVPPQGTHRPPRGRNPFSVSD